MGEEYQGPENGARAFRVRDHRKKEMFKVDDAFLKGYARECGLAGCAVYLSLCRHADRDQESWPSIELMAHEFGLSKRTVIRAIRKLEELRIIRVTREKAETGRQKVNVYCLTDHSEWSRVTPGNPVPGDKNDANRVTKTTESRVTPGHRKDTQREGDTVKEYADRAEARPADPESGLPTLASDAPKKVKDENDPMSLDEFVTSCDSSPQRHVNLIGAYAEAVRPGFTTKGQWRAFIKRNLRPARELSVFTTEQISGAFAKIKDAEREGWLSKFTMETLIKFLV